MFAPPPAGIRRLGRLVSQNPVACAYPTAELVGGSFSQQYSNMNSGSAMK